MKIIKRLLIIVILLISLVSVPKYVYASIEQSDNGVSYRTYTLGTYQGLVPTQTAYLSIGTIADDLALQSPEDIFYYQNLLYIADSKDKKIVVMDLQGVKQNEYALPEFVSPTGVFVNEEALFIADKGAKTLFKLDHAGNILMQVTKPTSALFGQSNDFVPIKVAVGSNNSIYVIGEGSTSGIIMLNYAGEFMGYLGINKVAVSLREAIYNFFVSDTDSLARTMPPSPTNVALGQKGSILSTNINVTETFKRLNISGINTLGSDTYYPTSSLSDITMANDTVHGGAYIYMTSSTGDIYEYDSNGQLLFTFNTKDDSMSQVLGMTNTISGIVVSNDGTLYVLDQGYKNVQVYQKTYFADLVHQAVTLYNEGKFLESKLIWQEIVRQNSSFALAHSAIGEALMKEEDYEGALDEFYQARDYNGYSNAFWEIRNVYIQRYLPTFCLVVIILIVVLIIFKRIWRHTEAYKKQQVKRANRKYPKLIRELLFSLNIIKHPSDTFYGIKRKNRASYWSGIIVFGLFLVVYLLNIYTAGFLFRTRESLSSVFGQMLIVIGIFVLYVIVNYFISTLSDGEGRFKDIFIASAYTLVPYILLTLPMSLLSHFLTYNETFIYTLYNDIILGWTAILLIYSLKEIHNYNFWELIRNILIIIFGMLIVIVIGLLVYSFMGQLIEFIESIMKEVIYRVQRN